MTSKGRCVILGICLTLTLFLIFFYDGNGKQPDKNHTFNVVDRRIHSNANVQDMRFDKHGFSNETDDSIETFNKKYSDLHISGTKQVTTKLNPDEMEKYLECVKTAKGDRERNQAPFLKFSKIRRDHHTYLANKDAVEIEVGGNNGNDASEFIRLYNPRYVILEPLEVYAKMLTTKFKDNERVTVINLGLGEKNEVVKVKIAGNHADATSKFSVIKGTTPLVIMNATEFLLKIGVGLFDVDLFTMNCEGCEFEVLEAVLSTNLVKHLRNIQFDTHSTIKGLRDPIQRYCRIQQLLLRTHRPTYQYKFFLENWRRHDLK